MSNSKVISVSGKGGVGKTTVVALMLRNFLAQGGRSILVVDADPSTNLPDILGVPVEKTVGMVTDELKREIAKGSVSSTISKESVLEARVFEVLAETPEFDLLAMGRSEGEGCYCMVNHMLTKVVDALSKNYDLTLMDMEAGLEHLSRRTDRDVDIMLIVTDQSKMGLQTAKRIKDLAKEVHIEFKEMYLIGNRFEETLTPSFQRAAEAQGLTFLGAIPPDPDVLKFSVKGVSLLRLPLENPAVKKTGELMGKMGLLDAL